jgi:MtN3 and saliva related transmembrane protein
MNTVTFVGILASILIAIYLLPQLVKLIREKNAGNISMLMLLILIAGQVLWIWYGILKKDWIIISSNIFSALVNLLIIFFSLRYKQKRS